VSDPVRYEDAGLRTPRKSALFWVFVLTAASAWACPASAQQPVPHAHHANPVRPAAAGSAQEGLRKRFEALMVRTTPSWSRPGAAERAEMFKDFLIWPRNPLEVELTVRFTALEGVGHVIGTLTVKNGEILVAGRKETALFVTPALRGLPPGLYAFHVHENPACGPGKKDGESVPGLAAGGHLWMSGTGAFSGTTFASHLGDLPDLEVAADGTASKTVVAARLTLVDVAGRAFIIHASQDDTSVRLACAAFD
jgi:Cu-Zn family superoxide dismutase